MNFIYLISGDIHVQLERCNHVEDYLILRGLTSDPNLKKKKPEHGKLI
jgi:hypothetical protein